ncbi:MAG: 4Fe-4S dicluster domain-containing protein [Verrucomicrobiae bacterium]|nr:4Fe-4S dicluster domain-containing protein [Verrucomicrobiae bacterium]
MGPGTGERLLRRLRGILFLAAVAVAWPLVAGWDAAVPLAVASPMVAVGSLVAAPAARWTIAIGLGILVWALWRRRAFCRHVCPVGVLQGACRGRWNHRRGAVARAALKWPIGSWIFLLTLGGALVGYPLFLWLDPLALFGAALNAWRGPVTLCAFVAGIALPAVLLLEMFEPRLWCMRFCPLGAMQDWAFSLARRIGWPFAARAAGRPGPAAIAKDGVGRRTFIGVGIGAAWGAVARASHADARGAIRPPGSVDEDRFTGLCIRCGNCIRACPPQILRQDTLQHGWAGLLAPVASFDSGYCREDCHRCTEVCPSGAIERLGLPEKRRVVMGIARIDESTCLLATGGECTACITQCPYEALAVAESPDGFSSRPRLSLDKCTGCGACEAACPVRPVRAIRVFAPDGGEQGRLQEAV